MNGCGCIYEKYVKRFLDITISLVALLLFSWLYLLLAALVLLFHGKPVIYSAVRVGKNEKPFKLYKFRSMTNACDAEGNLLPGKDRLTKFGRLLRASSLDELPEIYNILKGEMSIVGPRPLPEAYLPYYTEEERPRHNVRPGLTGLAQANGRNAISWDKKFEYDVSYVQNVSLLLDLKILLKTVVKVLKRDGIGQGEKMPMSLHLERQDRKQKVGK